MSKIAKALYEHDDAFAEMADVLWGDGGYELLAKMSPDSADISTRKTQARQKRQAQVGLATNVVGITAGTAATAQSIKDYKQAHPKGAHIRMPKGKLGALKRIARNPKALAGAAVGLQALNLGGDAVANRVLAREAKKKINKADTIVISKGTLKSFKNTVRNMEAASNDLRQAARSAPEIAHNTRKLTRRAKFATGAGGASVVAGAAGGGYYAGRKRNKKASLVPVAKSESADVTFTGELSKMDSDKRQVFGWASVTEVGGEPVYDRQGDYIALEEIEKSAYHYVHNSRKGGDMHERDGEVPIHKSDMIESFVVTPEKLEKMGLKSDALPHGWWVGYQCNDDELWNLVKSGKRVGFSIHGRGVRTPMGAI